MSGFMNKMLNMVGFSPSDEYDDEYEYEEEGFEPSSSVADRMNERRSSRVVKLHNSANQMRVVVFQPESFDEAKDIANHLKDRRPVVVNIASVEKQVAQKIIDFLGGAVYALDGDMQKVSREIFIIAPSNVDIMNGGIPEDTIRFSTDNR